VSRVAGFDVIIIGAGSVGVPAALAMAEAGKQVLVLDRAASQGQGSHKAAIGGVRATHSEPSKIRLCQRTLDIFSTWEERRGDNIEWQRGGYSFVAYRDEEESALKSLLETQRAASLDIDWYDADALREIIPDLNADGLRGGTFSPADGHCSTLLAGHALYVHAQRAGARFHFREPVTRILMKDGRVRGVETPAGRYEADTIVNAAGAWAAEIGRTIGVSHPVSPDAHEAGITEPVAPFLGPMIVDIRPLAGAGNCYFFQLRSGQVAFSLTPDPIVPGLKTDETSGFLPLAARRMIRLVPRLAEIRVRRTWRGLYPMTPDGSPLVGWSESVEGYLIAVGMCGQGFMLGPGLGELLARMLPGVGLAAGDEEILQDLSPYRRFSGSERLK